MTCRLVGLMSLVLLLSLAAFALLMSSYQAGVMEEVTRTVSAVGKATLQTFEMQAGASPGLQAPVETNGTAERRGEITYEIVQDSAGVKARMAPGGGVAILYLGEGPPSGAPESDLPTEKKMVHIRIAEVRAETDPVRGTVLRIPTWRVEKESLPAPGGPGEGILPVQAREAHFPARTDVVVNVPTADFQDLFAAFRRRTLILFLGILVVGTVLSAGLASRFTSPVRRLDAGIRRLTEGDLEVQVEADGRDEIGRLARGFNEMTRRLRAIREREREVRRREKLSALGRMAAGVAHDVRNPLHSISLTLQNLEETARPGEPARAREFDRSAAVIREEIRRLDRLVENFLRFARSDRKTRVPVDLARLAGETAQLVEKEAGRRGVQVQVVARGETCLVEGDMESIRSSVLNLVLNSFEAMPGGGTLTLTVGSVEGETRLEVADTGRGIPLEDQERVFEFAYTTREEGHGLGLAMVHQVVVEDHGGRVSLESRPGEGTRVLLAFPTGAAAARTEAPS